LREWLRRHRRLSLVLGAAVAILAVAAARGYFSVSPRRLTWGEASLLAGLPQAPSAYDPVHHLSLARLRQRHVLDQLVADGHLGVAAADAAFREPLPLRGGG
jgi:membrane peptidoglycan carboxypeptidase